MVTFSIAQVQSAFDNRQSRYGVSVAVIRFDDDGIWCIPTNLPYEEWMALPDNRRIIVNDWGVADCYVAVMGKSEIECFGSFQFDESGNLV